MKALQLAFLVVLALVLVATPVLAQEGGAAANQGAGASVNGPNHSTFSGAGVGVGIGAALTIIGAGYGFGRIGSSALESMARQPEIAGRIQTAMLIIAALLEGATFFSLIVCILLNGNAKW